MRGLKCKIFCQSGFRCGFCAFRRFYFHNSWIWIDKAFLIWLFQVLGMTFVDCVLLGKLVVAESCQLNVQWEWSLCTCLRSDMALILWYLLWGTTVAKHLMARQVSHVTTGQLRKILWTLKDLICFIIIIIIIKLYHSGNGGFQIFQYYRAGGLILIWVMVL
jgi:hypothetical protein